MVQNVSVI